MNDKKRSPAEAGKRDISFTVTDEGTLLETARGKLKNIPSGKVKSYLEHRLISVDGVVTSKFDYPLKPGQQVTIRLSGSGTSASPLPILYEDDVLLAVDKPAGLLTVASDTEKERTAWHLMNEAGVGPLFVTHRLDRDTSGVLLFAKSAQVRDALQSRWDGSRREYTAVCEGVFEEKAGRIDTCLRETATHMVYSAPSGDGKRAITEYEVLRDNGRYSMLRVSILTGRKNQIRVHMKELGHPVVGDKKYGSGAGPLGRLGLHASLLGITHPVTGAELVITSHPPRALRLPNPEGRR